MVDSLKSKKNRILNKYSKLIDQTIKEMSNRTMGEFWDALDLLKAKMAAELEKAGVKLED